tara:strand:+ start:313 stop:489 length:177 start_codon:yes stop_codon:yes gene_type:complete
MPFHLKRINVLDPNKTVYYVGGVHFSDDFSKRKTYTTKSYLEKLKENKGFSSSVVVEE